MVGCLRIFHQQKFKCTLTMQGCFDVIEHLRKKPKNICPYNPNCLKQKNWKLSKFSGQTFLQDVQCSQEEEENRLFPVVVVLAQQCKCCNKVDSLHIAYIAQQNRLNSAGNLCDSLKGLFRWEKIGLEWVKNILWNAISAMLFILILNEIYLTVTPYAQWCCPQDDNSIL